MAVRENKIYQIMSPWHHTRFLLVAICRRMFTGATVAIGCCRAISVQQTEAGRSQQPEMVSLGCYHGYSSSSSSAVRRNADDVRCSPESIAMLQRRTVSITFVYDETGKRLEQGPPLTVIQNTSCVSKKPS